MDNLLYLKTFVEDPILQLHVSAFLLGIIRILMFIHVVPIFGNNVSTPIKFSIAFALYLPIHPFLITIVEPMHLRDFGDALNLMIIVIKEAFIGFLFGWLVSLIFYVSLSAGTIVDNQRGASMAQGADVFTGAETSPLGNILYMSVITLFFSSGAFLVLLTLFYSTYFLIQPQDLIPNFQSSNLAIFTVQNLSWMMEKVLLVAIPFVLVSLCSDISLGLVNRFAPQLNVFILSMAIKSALCSFLVIFYFNPFIENSYSLFEQIKVIYQNIEFQINR